MRSIASAPCRTTGLIWCRYTVSVVAVSLWPASRDICSMGMPSSESAETNVWRSSRGVHDLPVISAAATILRNARSMVSLSSRSPVAVAKHQGDGFASGRERPRDLDVSPDPQHRDTAARKGNGAAGLARLGIAVARTDRQT